MQKDSADIPNIVLLGVKNSCEYLLHIKSEAC